MKESEERWEKRKTNWENAFASRVYLEFFVEPMATYINRDYSLSFIRLLFLLNVLSVLWLLCSVAGAHNNNNNSLASCMGHETNSEKLINKIWQELEDHWRSLLAKQSLSWSCVCDEQMLIFLANFLLAFVSFAFSFHRKTTKRVIDDDHHCRCWCHLPCYKTLKMTIRSMVSFSNHGDADKRSSNRPHSTASVRSRHSGIE